MRASGDLDARIAEAVERFPVLAEKADQQASVLSGVEQKMLEVARAILLRPAVLLIDEPSIGLSCCHKGRLRPAPRAAGRRGDGACGGAERALGARDFR